jgi:uncharacterized protein
MIRTKPLHRLKTDFDFVRLCSYRSGCACAKLHPKT